MHIINLTSLAEGVYNDHKADHIVMPPDGWAVILHEGDPIPKEWEGKEIGYSLPSTFPRLGSIEAEELTYIREVEVQKEVTKTREVESFVDVVKTREVETVDDEGNPITVTEEYTELEPTTVTEEYTEMETVIEEREYTMMTVTAMTEGTLPEPVEPAPTQMDIIEAQVTYTALMTDTLLEV